MKAIQLLAITKSNVSMAQMPDAILQSVMNDIGKLESVNFTLVNFFTINFTCYRHLYLIS